MGKLSALWDIAKKEGADLADDAASRMARAAEQGYGDTFYHATDKDFTEFMPSGWRGTNSFAPTPEGAIRGANSGGAEHVAIAGAGNPNTIYPVRMRGKIYGQDAPPDWWLPESVTYGEYRDILAKNKELPIPDEIAAQLNQNQIEQLQYMRRNDALNNYKEGVPESEWGKYAVYNDKGMVIDTSADMPMKLATEYAPPKPFMYQDIEGPKGYKSSWVDDYPGDRRDLLQKIGYTGARVDDEGGKSISMFDPSAIRSVNAAFDPAKKDSANLLAGLGGAAVLGGSLAPEDAEAGVITKVDDATGAVKRMIEAWHGSPHSFDKFDISKIGTGEGAQAYGHGLYFADARGVAEDYRKTLSDRVFEVDGKEIVGPATRYAQTAPTTSRQALPMPEKMATYALDTEMRNGSDSPAAAAIKHLEKHGKGNPDAQAAIDLIKQWDASGGRVKQGSLYRTEIDVDPDTLMDYDKPLSEQSEAVKSALRGGGHDFLPYKKGSDVVQGVPGASRVEQAQYLNSLGIPGIRYLDGMSRNRPLKDVKREFLAELPESAEIDDVMEMLGTGQFSPKNETLLNALAEDDWLGFDYPAQAISAALSPNVGDWDASDNLMRAIADVQVENPTYNYVMFDDKPISIVERGSADPALLGAIGVGAATTTALAPEMYRQMEETRRVLSDFATLRAPKASFWKQKRDELLELAGAGIGAAVNAGINTVASNPVGAAMLWQGGNLLEASQQPVQGVSALTALIASGDLNTAANVARMPQEAIADEAGGLVTDYLSQAGYPRAGALAGTAANVGINMAGF